MSAFAVGWAIKQEIGPHPAAKLLLIMICNEWSPELSRNYGYYFQINWFVEEAVMSKSAALHALRHLAGLDFIICHRPGVFCFGPKIMEALT